VAIEACLQICNILVASFGLRRPDGYHELLSIVSGQQLIPRTLAYRLELLTNLRDTLVHDASNINHDLLYDHIQQRLEDLDNFVEIIEKKLE
jgi:uncharacterized protein YutE (UPF0331/DUF86 family)